MPWQTWVGEILEMAPILASERRHFTSISHRWLKIATGYRPFIAIRNAKAAIF